MTIYATKIPDILSLPKEEITKIFESENFDEYIEEVTAHKGCGNTEVPFDKIVVLRENTEYYVYLSQLNRTVYHIEKHTAEDEIYKNLKVYLAQK